MLTCDTFESVDQICEAIGEVLQSCCDDYENGSIEDICGQLFDAINVYVLDLMIMSLNVY